MRDNSGYEEALNTHGDDGMDDAGDETGALHLIPAPPGGSPSEVTPELQALIEREAGAMLREAFCRLLTACKHNPVRLYILMGRVAGLSYDEVGQAVEMSKQGVAKHLAEVGKAHPQLLAVARKRYHITPALADSLVNTEETRSPGHE